MLAVGISRDGYMMHVQEGTSLAAAAAAAAAARALVERGAGGARRLDGCWASESACRWTRAAAGRNTDENHLLACLLPAH